MAEEKNDRTPVLKIEAFTGDEENNGLSVRSRGTPTQVLGMIARARFALNKIEADVLAALDKDWEKA